MSEEEKQLVPITKDLIKDYLTSFGLANKLNDKEKYRFLNLAKACNLNPFKREIYCVKYGSECNIITGYEVYLKRAERSGKLSGWNVKILTEDNELIARITIYRKDWTEPLVWDVYNSEYNTGRALWKTKPNFMLKKVAIATGFRLAFPEDLGGMPYTSDELDTMDEDTKKDGFDKLNDYIDGEIVEDGGGEVTEKGV